MSDVEVAGWWSYVGQLTGGALVRGRRTERKEAGVGVRPEGMRHLTMRTGRWAYSLGM